MNIIKTFNKKIFFFSFCILILSSGKGVSSDLEYNEVDTLLPYQINFDTAAFMNCPGDTSSDDSVFFTFKLGAYTSGLKLDPDTDLQDWSSLINAEAQLTLSQTGYPGRIAQIENKAVVETLTLNYPSVIQNLLRDGVSYKLGSINNASPVELELPYPGGTGLLNLLPILNTAVTVYLTYNDGEDTRPLKNINGAIYGRYFNFYFNPKTISYLKDIREYDIQDNRSRGQWICPEKFRFAIHRHPILRLSKEWECQEEKSVLSNWERQLFSVLMKDQNFIYGKTVKQMKDSNDTTQDNLLNQKCIRPTNIKHHCYNNNQDTAKEVMFEKANCVFQEDGTKVCPAYLSICIKLP